MAFLTLLKQGGLSSFDALKRKLSGIEQMPENPSIHDIAKSTPANKISPLGFRPVASRKLENDPEICSEIDKLLQKWGHKGAKYFGGGSISLVLETNKNTVIRITP